MGQAKITKELKPGRVLIISQGKHYNKLGILLLVKNSVGKNTLYRVLVLDHQFKSTNEQVWKLQLILFIKNNYFISKDNITRSDMYYKIVSLTPQHKFYHPEGIGGHTILDISAADIVEITKTNLKIDADCIIRNWEQRQIERFKDSPPGATVVKTVSELQQLNERYIADPSCLKFMDFTKEINNVSAENEMEQLMYLKHLGKQLAEVLPHTNIAGFEQEFATVHERKALERRIDELKLKNSVKNLSLYPDYCNKLKVLRALKYIDDLDEGGYFSFF